jgi:hypothetical protein
MSGARVYRFGRQAVCGEADETLPSQAPGTSVPRVSLSR